MGNLKECTIKYSYDDVMIKPAILSSIEHRSECNPFDENGMLPIFTAPMDCVVNTKNFDLFKQNKIIPILPRTEPLEIRINYACNGYWAAFSLREFEDEFTKNEALAINNGKILIDIANGHIAKLYELVKKAKNIYKDNIQIMVGNIANPETYRICVESKVDFVRCSIGTGAGCISSSNLGVHYPIASLISEIHEIKKEYIKNGFDEDGITKIVADGGIRNYSDIIKAIGALGADYVMVGSVFAKMLESAAPKTCNSDEWHNLPIGTEIKDLTDVHRERNAWYGTFNGKKIFLGDISTAFYGMASREGQIALNGIKTKTSEGIKKRLSVEYTMSGWVENMIDYLKSAMSYTDCRTIKEFCPNNVDCLIISEKTQKSINK